ncbi:unnamed protein product, partial [Adineta steineri]
SGKTNNAGDTTNDTNKSTNGSDNFKPYGQTSADSDSSVNLSLSPFLPIDDTRTVIQ